MANLVRTCRCISLHTYPATVTADAYHVHVVTHVCHCGRVHFEEPFPTAAASGKPRRRQSRARKVKR